MKTKILMMNSNIEQIIKAYSINFGTLLYPPVMSVVVIVKFMLLFKHLLSRQLKMLSSNNAFDVWKTAAITHTSDKC